MLTRATPVTFLNREGLRLFGHLSTPERPSDVAILLLNAGLKMRVGPHRIYSRMADCFAELGYTVLRFDFAGLGDSEGEVTEKQTADFYGSMQAGRYVADTIAAMDWLQRTRGVSRFVAAGLCGGAITALLAAETDPRIIALLGLGMPVILDGAHIDFSKYMTEGQLRGTRDGYLWKLRLWDARVWKSWWRFVTFQSDYGLITRALLNPLKKRLRRGAVAAPAEAPTDNTNPRFAPAFQRVLAGRKPVLLVFGEGDRLYLEFEEKFLQRHRAQLSTEGDRYELHLTKHANHIFSLPEWQTDMLECCTRWLARAVPPRPQTEAGAA
jgi:pimeloyl-ACP methyl ester carboxylesterase